MLVKVVKDDYVACLVCGSKNVERIGSIAETGVDDTLFIRPVWQCLDCGAYFK